MPFVGVSVAASTDVNETGGTVPEVTVMVGTAAVFAKALISAGRPTVPKMRSESVPVPPS